MGLLLGALGFEVAIRSFVRLSDFFWEPDPIVGAKLIPNKRGRAFRAGVYDVPVQVNSAGFRDREHSLEKPVGTVRIVLLGNSTIEALQVPFESSVTPLLEERLNRAGVPAEVINLGVSGFGTGREYLVLREYGIRYKPDLVLLFFVRNDLAHNSARLEGTPYLPFPVPSDNGLVRDASGEPLFTPVRTDQPGRLGFLRDALKNHSRAYQYLRVTIRNSPLLHALFFRLHLMSEPPPAEGTEGDSFGMFEIYRAQYRPEWNEAWGLTRELLLDTKRLAERHGAQFMVVLVAFPWEVHPEAWEALLSKAPPMRGASLDLDKPWRLVTSFLDAHRVPYVDLLPVFRARAANSPALFLQGDPHWAVDGHRLAADLVADAVTRKLTGR